MKYEIKKDSAWLVREEQRVYEARGNGILGRKRKRFRLIDVFAGAGGMTLGFSKMFAHAFDSVWANDFDDACVRTYRKNFGDHCVSGDIVDILNDPATQIPPADVVIGGPPCQGFSLLNKNREGDPRKQLWRPFLDVVERSGAQVFVMENVPQLLGSFEHGEIIGTAETIGFKCWSEVLCAADYGVPQTRRRAFIVGCKFFDPSEVFPPRKTHFDPRKGGVQISFLQADRNGYLPGAVKWRTVHDAIADLPQPKGTEIRDEDPPFDLHFGRSPTPMSIARYKAIPEEGMNRFDLQKRALELVPGCWIRKKSGGTDLFGRLWWDRPAFTIRTEFFKPEKGRYLHPNQHRPITHREAARLQSFPDEFIFTGSKIQIARQIGNAVPPGLAARVADVVYLLLTMNDR
ncbi:MAG: putative BsuMI modification methylase subunit YdiO [Syntrophaceae bacterium PtaB.Bin095]|nr:MAG: putative BsuMI modification methylase subunit YdiO [Syntrophaceae bacterium PtaB.Bin095]